ncbi:MAG TPA: hypothetical protein VLY04_00070 [Bryobacteraceae bacterium]|nr:hypothetical protein [Bryobacteraceae bacterium]
MIAESRESAHDSAVTELEGQTLPSTLRETLRAALASGGNPNSAAPPYLALLHIMW